eukprot:7702347-Alexandrium_andersonii.AAC.1
MPASASTPSGAYADVSHPKSRVGMRPSHLTGTTACSPGCKTKGSDALTATGALVSWTRCWSSCARSSAR